MGAGKGGEGKTGQGRMCGGGGRERFGLMVSGEDAGGADGKGEGKGGGKGEGKGEGKDGGGGLE